jgi:hypothetical protein
MKAIFIGPRSVAQVYPSGQNLEPRANIFGPGQTGLPMLRLSSSKKEKMINSYESKESYGFAY